MVDIADNNLPQTPQPSASASADAIAILPPDLAFLADRYAFTTLSVGPSSRIHDRVSKLLQHLSSSNNSVAEKSQRQPPGPSVAALSARPGCAGKLASAVEIAKREFVAAAASREGDDDGGGGGKLFQYTQLSGRLFEYESAGGRKKKEGEGAEEGKGNEMGRGKGVGGESLEDDGEEEVGDMHGDEDGGEERAFETMGSKPRVKIRALPALTIYLSRVSVPELKERFGEQSLL